MRTLIFLVGLLISTAASAQFVTGLEGASGSTIGPDRALYVTEGLLGRVSRVDLDSGAVTPITADNCLPVSILSQIIGFGGAVDVAFVGNTPYVLVTAVAPPLGGDVSGIYRVDAWDTCTPVADIGEFSEANLPSGFPIDLVTGLQYSLEAYRGGFLVTDGHHNRVLHVAADRTVSEFFGFDHDVVPTGLALRGDTVYLAEAGPTDHLPEDGKVVTLYPGSSDVTEIASGAPLVVDVEFGRGNTLFALSQGVFPAGAPPAVPALPDTGALLRVNGDGGLTVVVGNLDRPTSLEIVDNVAYVVSLSGSVFRFENAAGQPFGF